MLPKALSLKNYRLLYLAGFISEFGSFITDTALLLLIYKLSDQNEAFLGISRSVFLVGITFGSIIGGALGSRYTLKNILIATNILRVPLVFLLLTAKDPSIMVALNGLIAFFTGIFNPSRQALVSHIIPKESIDGANSLFGSTMAILHLVGPFLGAWFFTFFSGIHEILVFDLFTYFVGILFISQIYILSEESVSKHSHRKFKQVLIEGFQLVMSKMDLLAIYGSGVLSGISTGMLFPLLLPYIKSYLKSGEIAYGVLLSGFGFGGLIGGYLSQLFTKKYQNGRVITICTLIEPLIMVFWLLQTTLSMSIFAFFIWGIAIFIRIPAQLNYISRSVEPHFLPNCYSLLDLTFVIPNIIAGILIAFIAGHFEPRELLWMTSILFLILSCLRVFGKALKELFHSPH